MAKPQFKNSSMRLNTDIAVTDKISISFWFNKPNLQYQRKDGDSYTTVASSNLFIPDERAAELKNIAPPEVSQSEPLPDQIPSDNSFDGVSYGGGAGVFPGSN